MNTQTAPATQDEMSEPTVNEPVIDIQGLKKSFGGQHVLKNVSMQLLQGENLVVLGKSGSGKSVLIKCIVRLMDPDGGVITVLGNNINARHNKHLGELRSNIGFLFQSGALYDSMTVRENLEFPLRHLKRYHDRTWVDSKVMEVLEHVGLPDSVDKMPSQLSGGMCKRISLARTIIVDPKILLYDEPTTGLDPVTSAEISSLIMDVQNKYKTSSIIITHDIACARTTADRIVMLHDGEVHKTGTLEEFETSTDGVIRPFFTTSQGKP